MPARVGDLARAARQWGIELERPNKGSHWKFRRAGLRPYPVPAHNGERTELDDKYIKGMARALGIDPKELMLVLRSGRN